MRSTTGPDATGRWVPQVAALAMLVLAAAVRVYGVGGPGLYADEAASLKVALHSIPEIVARSGDLSPPLYYVLLHVWIGILGTSVVAMRSLSVVLGVAAVGLIGWVANGLLGRRGAALAMGLLTVSPVAIFYSQMARSYSLFLALSIASFGLLVLWEERRRGWAAVLWVVVTAAMAYTHNFWVFNFAAQQVYVLVRIVRGRLRARTWLAMTATFVVLVVPWLPGLMARAVHYQQQRFVPLSPDLGDLFHAVQQWVVWKGLAPGVGFDLEGILSLPFAALAFYGLVRLLGVRQIALPSVATVLDSRPAVLLTLWVAVPVITPWAWSQVGKPIFGVSYIIAASAAYAILIGNGIRELPWPRVRVGILLLVAALAVANVTGLSRRSAKQDWRGLAGLLAAQAGPDDVVIVMPPYHELPLAYYRQGPQAMVGRVGFEVGHPLEERVAAAVDRTLGRGGRLWLVAVADWHRDRSRQVVGERAPCARESLTTDFVGLHVIAFDFDGCQ